MGDISEAPESSYLALREAKIKRNEARLRELGLLRGQSIADRQSAAVRKVNPRAEPPPSMLRRSKRLANQPDAIDYKEKTVEDHFRSKRARVVTPTSIATDEETQEETLKGVSPKAKALALPKQPSANSVRSISLCTKRLTLGDDTGRLGLLGKQMDQPGKEFVIYESFRTAASLKDKDRLGGFRLSFNKYSGVQEWQDCIFLWVNLGAKGNSVVNEFLDDGRQMTWFGGSRMVDDTPLAQKLLALGRSATESTSKLVLWCRIFDPLQKKFNPYVCLGRISYKSHQAGSYPLAFVWNLLDVDLVKNHSDNQVRSNFQQMIDAASTRN